MNKNVNISMASYDDARRIADIELHCFSLPWSENAILESMQQNNYIFLKAEINDEIVGYIGFYYSFDEGDITNIAVRDIYRRQGIGESLIYALIEECKNRKINSIMLEVRISNDSAINLYRKIGFGEIGIRKKFYERPVEDAMLMKYIVDEEI